VALLGLIVAVMMAVLPAPASAGHSWNNYHWARTGNPFTVQLGDNVDSNWDGHLGTAAADWSQSNVLDAVVTGGGGCAAPRSGYVDVCNADYGGTGWLGIAQVWIGNGHIVQGVAKMNDYYFSQAGYNTPAWRQFVMCQEVGHTFGLGHTDETHTNANQGTCMDYTNDPDGGAGGASATDASNEHPNKHDYDQLAKIYRHKDATTSVSNASSAAQAGLSKAAAANPSGPERGGVAVFETDLGAGNRVVTFVIWADANVIGAAHANEHAPIVEPTTAADAPTATDAEGFPVDSDADGLIDEDEVAVYGTDPLVFDTDADGLGDGDEVTVYGTDPLSFDTDADGMGDGDEVAAGSDPLTAPADAPTPPPTDYAEGATVVTTDAVNLRATPSRQGDILAELAPGTSLTVTGAVERAQGLDWVPVTTAEGLSGYVAADFVVPAAPAP
jgi:hypothetical protein